MNFRRLRPALLVSTLLLAGSFARAMEAPALPARDAAAALLQHHGRIRVAQAGAHVAPGTYRIQVATKLGQPEGVLPDGSWLYHGRTIEGSAATGTLVVHFAGGRVSSLAMVSPATLTALRIEPRDANADRLARR